MKVCQIGTGMSSISEKSSTATESVIYNLSKEIRKLCNLHIIDLKDNAREKLSNIKYHEIKMPEFWGAGVYTIPGTVNHVLRRLLYTAKTIFKFISLMQEENFDVIHCHNQYTGFVLSLINRIFYKKKFVYTLHTPFWTLPDEKLPKLFFLKSIVEKACMKNSAKVITLSKIQKEMVERRTGLNKNKITCIPNGVDLSKFRPKGDNKKSFLARRGDKIILCVARISPVKNQLVLLKAASIILKKIRHAKFVFIGQVDDASYFNKLLCFVKENNLENFVKFAKPVENSEMPSYYRTADIFVLPSFAEGLPLVVLEAMACGIPIIASDIKSNRDFNKDKNLVYFNPDSAKELAEKIEFLLKSKKKQEALKKSLRKTAEKFYSWKKIAEKVISIYKES